MSVADLSYIIIYFANVLGLTIQVGFGVETTI